MHPRLAAADCLDRAIEILRMAANEAGNVTSASVTHDGFVKHLYDWHADTHRQLAGLLTPHSVQELLYSPNFWALRALHVTASSLRPALDLELAGCQQRLQLAHVDLAAIKQRWRSDADAVVVPDSSVLMNQPESLLYAPWHQLTGHNNARVVLLLQVIDELDGLKAKARNPGRARTLLREIHELDLAGSRKRHNVSDSPFVCTVEVFGDPLSHQRLPDADSEIIDRALLLQEYTNRSVVLVTADIGMEVRGREAGLRVVLRDFDDRPDK